MALLTLLLRVETQPVAGGLESWILKGEQPGIGVICVFPVFWSLCLYIQDPEAHISLPSAVDRPMPDKFTFNIMHEYYRMWWAMRAAAHFRHRFRLLVK